MNSEFLIEDLREILTNNFEKLKIEKEIEQKADQAAENTASADPGAKADQSIKTVDDKLQKQHVVNQVLNQYIMSFEAVLPRPNSVTLDNLVASFDKYSEALDKALDAWLSDKFFNQDLGGQVANQVEAIKEMIKAHFLRQWMSENGMLTELSALTATDEEGKPSLDIYELQQSHMEALTKSLTALMVGLQTVKKASDTIIQEKVGDVEEAPSSSDDSSSSDDGGDDLGGGDDLPDFGGDDLGGGGEEEDAGGGIANMGENPSGDNESEEDDGSEENADNDSGSSGPI